MKNSINQIIEGREKDIGIKVRRILPWSKKRMVGPFIFLDEMGPALLHAPSDRMDVRPHPHIGLSTLTYLFEGSMLHRDSLGVTQEIIPGEINWMTAGKGIAHSERETEEVRKHDRILHGLQFWVALPKEVEDMNPIFEHYGKEHVPHIKTASSTIDVIAGSLEGHKAPLKAYSPMVFYIIRANTEGKIQFPSQGYELALYIVKGSVKINEAVYDSSRMVVLNTGSDIEFTHSGDALVAVIGGTPFPEDRYIWWNFVSSSHEKIESAKKAWENGTFPQVPGDTDIIPLPKD